MQIGKYRLEIHHLDWWSFGVDVSLDQWNLGYKDVSLKFGKRSLSIQWAHIRKEGRSEWLI